MADQYNGGPAIAAISTPAGTGAIAIIRISGRESIEIVDAVFQPADKSSLRDSPSHTIHYGWIVDPQTQDSVDEVLSCSCERRGRLQEKMWWRSIVMAEPIYRDVSWSSYFRVALAWQSRRIY